MSTWTPDELDRVGAADELQIAPARQNGSLRPGTTIWVVRVGDELYVRSYRGRGGAWFRTAARSHQGRIRTGGVERDVRFEEPDGGSGRRSTRPTGPSTPATRTPTSTRSSATPPPRPPFGSFPADPAPQLT